MQNPEEPKVRKNHSRDLKKELGEDWGEIEKIITSLAAEHKPGRLPILTDIFKAVYKLAKDSPGTLNLKITSSVLKELRYSFKMFSPHRTMPKITMFGSARTPPGTPLYDFAKKFASDAVTRGFMIITGGGPGIMAAGNEGAEKNGFGLNIRLPFEQEANKFIVEPQKLINYKYFFTRKLFLVKEATAFAFFPGGFGTFDEAFEVLTLMQTGKSSLIPIVFLEPRGFGFWEGFFKFIEKDVQSRGFISPDDKNLYRVFHGPKEGLDHIQHFYSVYHSVRFVRDKASVRLKKPISQELVAKIQKKFASLSIDGQFSLSGPLSEETNEPELSGLTRLVFRFERKDYAGLRRLVDFINDSAV